MTSASELFYTRRSRLGRPDPDLGSESSLDRSFHQNYNRRHHNHHHHRHDLDGCDPLRRSSHVRHLSHRGFLPERTPVRLEQGTNQIVSSSSINTETLNSRSRPSLTGNDRLPGAVLLARARLLERLRGVSVPGNRQSGRASSEIYRRESMFGDDLRLIDAGDWGTDISSGWSAPFTELTSQTERLQFLQEKYKKPSGLSQDALDSLPVEVFSCTEIGVDGRVSRGSGDCSICLESFMEGDVLIRLPCAHRFHSSCLDPWVRTCGDCPYCRRVVLFCNVRAMNSTSTLP